MQPKTSEVRIKNSQLQLLEISDINKKEHGACNPNTHIKNKQTKIK